MKFTSSILLLTFVCLSQPSAHAAGVDIQAAIQKAGSYIVELDGTPGNTNIQAITNSHFTELFNGFTLHANKDFDPIQIASIPGVKRYQASPTNITYPYLHHATGVDAVVQNLGFTGKGVKIGVVDSGVDFNHPELGNCWKTLAAFPVVKPGPHPMDCMGHGTHVAGIIAGQGPQVIGVAQDATMGMYRVRDIISLSLGGGGWPEDPTSVACSNMVKKGIIVVVANGNDGDAGLFTAGSPGLGHGVISVGSVDNWNITGMPLMCKRDFPFVFENNVPLVTVVDSANSKLGCATISQDLKGKVALIQRGNCTFNEKAANAQAAGAAGVIVYNNAPGMMSPSVTDPSVTIPVVIITQEDGAYAVSALASGNVTVKAPKSNMSDFSSYGPSPELDIAPIVSAPGGNIYSTYPLKLGGYISMSGTSMATPYISGTAALFKQAHPKYSVDQLRQALSTTAKPRSDKTTGKNIHPYWSGSGLVNIFDAINSRVEFSPSALALNNTMSGPLSSVFGSMMGYFPRWSVRRVSIKNTDPHKAARISFSNSVADSLTPWAADGTFNPKPRTGWSTMPQAYAPELHSNNLVGPGQTRNIAVVITAPYGLKDSERWFYGGFLNFTMSWGFPLLADASGNVTTAPVTEKTPQVFNFRLELPSRLVSITLQDSKKKTMGYLPGGYLEYVSRNLQTPETFMYSAVVNGTVFKDTLMTQRVKVPAGQYQINLNALRPLGNPKNPKDYQAWTFTCDLHL
ncbi:subtilisin-like protein, partial [Linderina pennispora]